MNKVQVKNISIHQSAKFCAIMMFILSAIICIPIGLIGFFTTGQYESLALVIAPLFYLIFVYIAHAIFFWFYNLVSGWVGGIEFHLEDHVE